MGDVLQWLHRHWCYMLSLQHWEDRRAGEQSLGQIALSPAEQTAENTTWQASSYSYLSDTTFHRLLNLLIPNLQPSVFLLTFCLKMLNAQWVGNATVKKRKGATTWAAKSKSCKNLSWLKWWRLSHHTYHRSHVYTSPGTDAITSCY